MIGLIAATTLVAAIDAFMIGFLLEQRRLNYIRADVCRSRLRCFSSFCCSKYL